jgi:hypothetical protein
MIASYNASAAKYYSATNNTARFAKKNADVKTL